MQDAVNGGSQTLWAAISQLEPGIQIAFMILIAVCAALGWFARYLLGEMKEARIAERAKDEANRHLHEQTLVALTVLKERLSK